MEVYGNDEKFYTVRNVSSNLVTVTEISKEIVIIIEGEERKEKERIG